MAIDVTNLAVVFGDTGVGQLTLKAWEDLQATRWAIEIFVSDAEMFTNCIQGPGQRHKPMGSWSSGEPRIPPVEPFCDWIPRWIVPETIGYFECGDNDERIQGKAQWRQK